ncbi:unnamed protein product [[Candida] boidinii]|nr:unnamed protein product [[Candida] boidinii]
MAQPRPKPWEVSSGTSSASITDSNSPISTNISSSIPQVLSTATTSASTSAAGGVTTGSSSLPQIPERPDTFGSSTITDSTTLNGITGSTLSRTTPYSSTSYVTDQDYMDLDTVQVMVPVTVQVIVDTVQVMDQDMVVDTVVTVDTVWEVWEVWE